MIISVTTLSEIRKKYRKHRIVFAGGVFDVFHIAHIKTLRKLRTYGDIVVIGVVSDKRVRERKGPNRPIILQKERREIVDAIKYVDFVVQMPNPNRAYPRPTIFILKKLFTVKKLEIMLSFIYNTDFNPSENLLETIRSVVCT